MILYKNPTPKHQSSENAFRMYLKLTCLKYTPDAPMYGIYLPTFHPKCTGMVHVGRYFIHGAYGYCKDPEIDTCSKFFCLGYWLQMDWA